MNVHIVSMTEYILKPKSIMFFFLFLFQIVLSSFGLIDNEFVFVN